MTDAFYSFGTAYPGAIILNHYPHLRSALRGVDNASRRGPGQMHEAL